MGRWRDTHSTVDLNGYEGTFMVSYFDSLGGFFFLVVGLIWFRWLVDVQEGLIEELRWS